MEKHQISFSDAIALSCLPATGPLEQAEFLISILHAPDTGFHREGNLHQRLGGTGVRDDAQNF